MRRTSFIWSTVLSAAAFLLLFFMPISVHAEETDSADTSAYTWTDTSGTTQTDGISTSSTSTSYDVYGTNTSDSPTITLSGTGTFTLTGDLQADLVVSGIVTLDLNGRTLTGTGISSVITIKSGGSLTIQDTSTNADGKITGGVGICWSSSYGFADEDTCELTYTTQTAYAMHGGGVFVCAGGSLTMTGGTISGNTALGADITHTSRSANGGYGGGIFFASDTSAQSYFTMSGGTITDNEAYGGGGIGAMAKSGYTLVLYIHGSSTKVDGNTASYGGGIYLKSNADLRLYDGASVSDNTASSGSGGGIYASSGSVYINNGSYAGTKVTISGNCAGSSGGGIYASGTYLNINNNGADITDNTAGTSGGGIYCGATVINLNSSNVTVSGNTAGSYGGGVYFKAAGKGKSASSFALQVTGNTADVGGGIYVYGSSSYYLTLTTAAKAVIANNTAVTAAADIYCSSYSTLSLTNNSNTAQTFEGDGQSQTITGWYDDSSSSRWAATESPSAVTIASGTEYYLIAAYSSEHSYGIGTWEWTGSDDAGYTSATLTVSCTVNGHTDTISTTVTPAVETVSATCTADGYTSYTAAASIGGIDYTETKTVTSTTDKATGHTYSSNSNVQWSWSLSSSAGGYTATAYVTCETCGSYIYSSATSGSYYDVNLSVSVTTTTEEDGIYYTATATYKVDDGEDMTWTCPYKYGPFVAATYTSSGTLKSYYATLAEAFSGATSSYTVKLLCNVTMSDSITLEKTTLTLDLNGCTLTYTGTDSAAFAVGSADSSSSRTLTVTDSSDSGTGAVKSTNGASIFAVYYALKINGGTFAVTSSDESTAAGAVVEGCGYAKNTYIWQYDDNGKMTGYTTTSTNCGCTVTVTGGIFNSTFYKENETYDGLTTVAISGGWFVAKVKEDHCADGYKPYANATGTATDGVEGMYTVGTFSAEIDYSSDDEDEEENSGSDDDESYTYTYNPSGTSVDFTVTFAGETQGSSTYSVKYTQITETTDEDGNTTTTETELDDGTLPTNVGTYTATVVSNDSSAFVGSGEAVTFTIVAKSLSADMLTATASVDSAPTVTVTDGSTTLTEDSDYTVSITDEEGNTVSDFSTAGAYTVTVTAVSGGNYTGSCSAYAIVYSIDGTVNSIGFVTPDSYSEYEIAKGPEKTGYTFYGWYATEDEATAKSGTKISSLTTASAQVLYGTYAANSYTISFNANGGSGDAMDTLSATYDTALTLTRNTYSLTGYTFAGWNTAADGSGTSYSDGASVQNLTAEAGGSVTLYAQWTANTYTIVFSANADDATGTTESISATYGVSYELTNGYTLADYTFAGWNTAADGSGTSYSDGTSAANLTTENGATVTLYAQWTAKTVVSAPDFSAQTYTYDGTGKTYSGTLTNSQGLSDFTITYTDADGNVVESPTDAGTYNVIISRAEDDTYASFSQTITGGLVITQAEQSVSFTSETVSAHVSDSSASENTLSGASGTVVYTSSDESVATVDADGNVTIVGAGEVTITATIAATANYAAASASYTLTVTDHQYSADSVVWTWSDDYTSATVTYTCESGGCTHTETVTTDAAVETVEATTNADGSITYTVSVTLNGVTYTETKVVTVEATGTDEEETTADDSGSSNAEEESGTETEKDETAGADDEEDADDEDTSTANESDSSDAEEESGEETEEDETADEDDEDADSEDADDVEDADDGDTDDGESELSDTGDTVNLNRWIALLFAADAAIALLYARRRKA